MLAAAIDVDAPGNKGINNNNNNAGSSSATGPGNGNGNGGASANVTSGKVGGASSTKVTTAAVSNNNDNNNTGKHGSSSHTATNSTTKQGLTKNASMVTAAAAASTGSLNSKGPSISASTSTNSISSIASFGTTSASTTATDAASTSTSHRERTSRTSKRALQPPTPKGARKGTASAGNRNTSRTIGGKRNGRNQHHMNVSRRPQHSNYGSNFGAAGGRPNNTNNTHPPFNSERNPLLPAFESGVFSDVLITTPWGKSYKCHRLLLSQSAYFARLFLDPRTNREVILVEGFLQVDFDDHPLVTQDSFERVLRQLYCTENGFDREQDENGYIMTVEERIQVIVTACFLELETICERNLEFIIRALSKDNVVSLSLLVDQMVSPSILSQITEWDEEDVTEPTQEQPFIIAYKYLKKYFSKLNTSCIGFLCQFVGYSNFDPNVLASLPLSWLKAVICHDMLVVPNEFARYELLKKALKIRENLAIESVVVKTEPGTTAANSSKSSSLENAATTNLARSKSMSLSASSSSSNLAANTKNGSDDTAVTAPAVGGGIGQVFGSLMDVIRKGKRKVDVLEENEEGDDLAIADEESTHHQSKMRRRTLTSIPSSTKYSSGGLVGSVVSAVGLLAQRPASATPSKAFQFGSSHASKYTPRFSSLDSRIIRSLFESTIVYTHMTFPQLNIVRSDGLVPENILLSSLWMQQSLTNGTSMDALYSMTMLNGPSTKMLNQSQEKGVIPPFRFATRFINIHKTLVHNPKGKNVMFSDTIVCGGSQYRTMLQFVEEGSSESDEEEYDGYGREDEEDGEGSNQQSESDSENGGDNNEEAETEGGESGQRRNGRNRSRRDKYYIKALLQRTKAPDSGNANTTNNNNNNANSVPISYSIWAFSKADLDSPRRLRWIQYGDPVTKCDSEEEGYAQKFFIPRSLLNTNANTNVHVNAGPMPLSVHGKQQSRYLSIGNGNGSQSVRQGSSSRGHNHHHQQQQQLHKENVEDELWLVVAIHFE